MDENLSREFSAPNLSDLSDVTSEKSSESQDDSCLYKRSVSADDLRLLYRDWRQGQSQGVPWSALKKQKDDLGQTDSAISKNSIKQPVRTHMIYAYILNIYIGSDCSTRRIDPFSNECRSKRIYPICISCLLLWIKPVCTHHYITEEVNA